MRKIAFVIPQFPVLSETFVSTEIRAMNALGHDVLPIAFERPRGQFQENDRILQEHTFYLCDRPNSDALKALTELKPSLFAGLKFALKQQGLPFKSLLGNALKLAYLVKKTGCTHLHAHFAQATAATAIVAARLCGATVSFVGHGYDVYATPTDLKLKLEAADFAVAVCEDMCHYFTSIAVNANIALVYCGIEMERFKPRQYQAIAAEHDEVSKPPSNVKKLMFIGRLCETKGLMTLMQALTNIAASHRPTVDIVGSGELLGKLQRYVDHNCLGQHVKFLGSKQSSWFIENAHHYDALVAPFEQAPNGDRDTGPVVVKEAMALRLPVLTTHFMGCKEMLTDSCALRVQPKDPIALAQMICQFSLMREDDVEAMVDNAYFRVLTMFGSKLQAHYLSGMVERSGEGEIGALAASH